MRLLLLSIVALCAGCTKYEYDIVRPPELARHVGTIEQVFSREPLEYRIVTVDNVLVMRIYNPADDPVTLLGDRSFAVDATGQSHPLANQTMAPHSFIKLIIPPPRPRLQGYGTTFGVGVSNSMGYGYGAYGWDALNDFPAQPQYFTVYDGDTMYWDWKGESEIRLMLVFQGGQSSFNHEFGIARRKM